MTCKACTEALKSPHSGMYHADCQDCTARMLAHSPICFDAAKAGAITPAYRDALQNAFGSDWLEGHARVKRWVDMR
jgi:hypothetical protein